VTLNEKHRVLINEAASSSHYMGSSVGPLNNEEEVTGRDP